MSGGSQTSQIPIIALQQSEISPPRPIIKANTNSPNMSQHSNRHSTSDGSQQPGISYHLFLSCVFDLSGFFFSYHFPPLSLSRLDFAFKKILSLLMNLEPEIAQYASDNEKLFFFPPNNKFIYRETALCKSMQYFTFFPYFMWLLNPFSADHFEFPCAWVFF